MHDVSTCYYHRKVSLLVLGSIDSLVQRRNYHVLKSNFTYLWPWLSTFHSTTLSLYHQRTTCTLNWDQRKLWRQESCVQCAAVNSIFYWIVIVSCRCLVSKLGFNIRMLGSKVTPKIYTPFDCRMRQNSPMTIYNVKKMPTCSIHIYLF